MCVPVVLVNRDGLKTFYALRPGPVIVIELELSGSSRHHHDAELPPAINQNQHRQRHGRCPTIDRNASRRAAFKRSYLFRRGHVEHSREGARIRRGCARDASLGVGGDCLGTARVHHRAAIGALAGVAVRSHHVVVTERAETRIAHRDNREVVCAGNDLCTHIHTHTRKGVHQDRL